jgi:L-rhamnose mutarotase
MFVLKFKDQTLSEWKRKTDPIHDIIELLSDSAVKNWSSAYYNNEDAFYGEDDE